MKVPTTAPSGVFYRLFDRLKEISPKPAGGYLTMKRIVSRFSFFIERNVTMEIALSEQAALSIDESNRN